MSQKGKVASEAEYCILMKDYQDIFLIGIICTMKCELRKQLGSLDFNFALIHIDQLRVATLQTASSANDLELEMPTLRDDLGIVVWPICKWLWVTVMTSFSPLQSIQRAGTRREQWKVKVHLR